MRGAALLPVLAASSAGGAPEVAGGSLPQPAFRVSRLAATRGPAAGSKKQLASSGPCLPVGQARQAAAARLAGPRLPAAAM